ncbi:MAG: diguanylate cyclase [Sulfuricurvum sp.]|uniref:diguanylate cyclase n=1 Tax=Sulfuricurvum sp. TaxID=2025608 RepID=UPI0027209FC5|nr:diguanylate cyclase [Sulfuricurvum sp.]MDO9057312.1 diguanylate cyclase [Sulfuricurvum sp.]
MIRFFILFLACISTVFGANIEKVSVQLDWKYQFEYAGYVAAKEKGYYREAGLDVELREYREGADVIADVLSRKSTYGIYNSSIVVDKGRIQPIVLMATYLQHSPLVFITQKGIENPADLIGKTIMGTNNEFKHSSLSLLLSHFNLTSTNSRFIKQTFSIDPFVRHEVDAMSAYRSNQLYELDRLKIAYEIIDPLEYGFVVNAGNLFTSHQEAVEHSERGQKFIDATNRGWKYALEHSDEIIDILKRKYGVKKSYEALRYESTVIKKLMMTDLYKIGETNGELSLRLFKQLLYAGIIQDDQKLGQFLFQDVVKSSKNTFQLSGAERNYLLQKKKITMCVDPEWYPLEAIREGKHIGIASDIMKNFESKIGIPIELIQTSTWSESLLKAENRQCDILSLAAKTPEREKYLSFTSTYLAVPLVMVTTMEKPFTENIHTLNGKKVGVVKGYATFKRLKRLYPSLNIVEVESVSDGLKKVENGHIYGYIDNLVVTSSYIQKEYTGSLKVSSRLEEKDELHVAVRKDEPILNEIFEKLVIGLDDLTLQKSYNRWASTIEHVAWIDRAVIGKIVFVIFLLLVAFIWRYTLLKRYNSRLLEISITDKLTGLYNRQKIDEKLNEEQRKVNRYRDYYCSIMMIDVDFFKNINDTLGHQEGDSVLRKLAEVMKKSLRETDAIGRWGGEEFIVILPHTSLGEAEQVAGHLRKCVSEYPFESIGFVTISIGVGEFIYDEEVHECVKRVDAALYKAKESGRNRVISSLHV